MIAVDTSVVVAAFARWHEAHAQAVEVLRCGPRLPAHVAVETYFPSSRDCRSRIASRRTLRPRSSPDSSPSSSSSCRRRASRALIETAPQAGIAGGAVYDAIVAASVLEAGGTLITRDAGARRTYLTVGVDCVWVGCAASSDG